MRPESDGPGRPIKEMLAERLFRRHLRVRPDHQTYNYLLDHAWTAFLLGIGNEETRSMLFVQWMCGQLAKSNPKEVGELLTFSFQEDYDSIARISRAEEALKAASKDTDKWLVAAIDLYKVYFESEFRLWSTFPFCFATRYFGLKAHFTNPADIVHVAASEKLNALKNVKVEIPQGDIKNLVVGFDNNIRNSGTGHDRWELSDEGTIVLSIRDPKTGKEQGAERIELNVAHLREMLSQIRKTIWILKMGVVLFSINNPQLTREIKRTKDVKLKEIELHVRGFAKDRWLELEEFKCEQDRSRIEMALQYRPGMPGTGGSVISGSGEAYDLISIESNEPYATQVMGVIQFMLREFFEPEKLPLIKLKCRDGKGATIGEAEFASADLKTLFDKPVSMPKPTEGALPEGHYRMQGEVRVPYGERAKYLAVVKSKLAPNMRIVGPDEIYTT